MAAAQQTLTFQIPYVGSGRFRLSVPGNVDVKSGLAVLRRRTDSQADVTQFEFLPSRDLTTLVMTLNNQQSGRQQVVAARTVYAVQPQGSRALVNFEMLVRQARLFENSRDLGLREFVRKQLPWRMSGSYCLLTHSPRYPEKQTCR